MLLNRHLNNTKRQRDTIKFLTLLASDWHQNSPYNTITSAGKNRKSVLISDGINRPFLHSNNGTDLRLGWTKIQQVYENVHPDLALVQLFELHYAHLLCDR